MKKKIVSLLLAVTLVAGITINNIGALEQVEASQSAAEVAPTAAEGSRQYQSVADVYVVDGDDMEDPAENEPFFADMIKLPDGTLLVAYDELQEHALWDETVEYGKIKLVRSTNNGKTWSEPQTVVTKEKVLDWGIGSPERPLLGANGMFTLLDDGTLLMFFVTSYIYDRIIPYDDYRLYVMASTDNGYTWKDPVLVPTPNNDSNLGQSKQGDAIQLEDGSVLIPSYTVEGATNNPYYDVWAKRGIYNKETNEWTWLKDTMICSTPDGAYVEFNAVDEAAFVTAYIDGVEYIYALIRNNGAVYVSTDKGETWENIAMEDLDDSIVLPNDQVLLCQPDFSKLPDGRIYVTYSLGHTRYGRPIYGKFFTPDPTKADHGWGDTTAELIYHGPNATVEIGDPASEYVEIDGEGKMFVICYDADTQSIPGFYVNLPENEVVKDVYTDLTVKDFGNPFERTFKNVQGSVLQTATPSATLDGKTITGIYNLSTTLGDRVVFGGSWSGITLGTSYDGNLIVSYYDQDHPGRTNPASEEYDPQQMTLWPKNLDGTSLSGRDMKIEVSFKFQNVNAEANTADVLFGITLDDVYTTHKVFKNMNTKYLTEYIGVHAGATPTTITDSSYAAKERLELLDFGIAELTSAGEQGYKASDESLIGKSVRGVYNFVGGSVLAYGKNSWFTFTLQAFDDEWGKRLTPCFNDGECGYQYGTAISAANIGGKDILGADVKIEAMFDFVKNEADDKGTFTVTLLIDDQYTFTYTYDNVSVANVTETIYTRGTSYKLADIGYANAETLTPKDFGVTGAQTISASQKIATDTPNASLHGKKVKGIYTLNNGSMLVYGSEEWAGSVILQANDYGGNQYIVPQIFDGAYVHGTTENTALPGGNIYTFNIGNKMFIGNELEIEAYFNFKDNEADGKDLELYLLIDGQYRFKYTWANAPVQYVNETMCATYNSNVFTVIEPSAYPDCVLPQSLGATLATDKDVVKMGFSFADVIANKGITKEDVASYGAVLVPGTKTAADLKAKAAEMIEAGETSSDIFVRTEGDIEKLFETEGNEYFVTITNSGDAENMHVRSTAIAYIKLTDGTIYYSADCNSDATQRVNKSVMGLLKSIFTANYVADYDAAVATGTEAETPLGKAIAKYNTDNGAAITIDTIKEIINRAKSTVEDRSILSGVHFKLFEV